MRHVSRQQPQGRGQAARSGHRPRSRSPRLFTRFAFTAFAPAFFALLASLAACGTSDGATSNGATSDGATSNGGTSNGATSDGGTSNGGGTVLVFAASSLADAFAEIAEAFESERPGVEVELSVAASSALREQILDGAPADVFASAAQSVMDEVEDAGATSGPVSGFAHNRLVVAVPTNNPGNVTSLGDLADPDLLVGLCAEGVPCGDLARRALAEANVEASIDTNEPDVRSLATRIAEGELDVGLIYATDVAGRDDLVTVADVGPTDLVADYAIAVLAEGRNPDGGRAFVEFVRTDQGRRILVSYGFEAS